VEGSCPVCQGPVPEGSGHCPKCGFPMALGERLDGPLAAADPPPPDASNDASMRAEAPDRTGGAEGEVNTAIARALQERMELLWTFDRDAPDATGALCEAALNEASGRVTDAQQILRSAQSHLDRETEELLARHLSSLEARGQALEATGLRLALEDELGGLAESIVAGDPASSIAAFLAAERRMDGVEAHWRGLQALLAQAATLSSEATDLGIDVGDSGRRLDEIRRNLAAVAANDHDLDVAAQAAAETLMQLHEAIPPALEAELQRHAGALEEPASTGGRAQSARRLHSQAVGHLKSGRLQDAVQSVRELRQELQELAAEVAARPPPQPPAPPAPAAPVATAPEAPAAAAPLPPATPATGSVSGPSADDAAMLATLTKKARTLAVRVRELPSDSVEAQTAARTIHEATDLLRGRRYGEADAALTRLMRLLAGSEPST